MKFLIDWFCFSSLDKELVKLAEKSAREREQREREKRERDNQPKTEPSNNQIQVKPIIETISPDPKPKYSKTSHVKMTNGDRDGNTTDDLLRFVIVDEE